MIPVFRPDLLHTTIVIVMFFQASEIICMSDA